MRSRSSDFIATLYNGLLVDTQSFIPTFSEANERFFIEMYLDDITFFTVDLPTISGAVIRGLEVGYFNPFEVAPLARGMFEPLLKIIFDDRGRLLDTPSVVAIECVRQLCEVAKKLELPHTSEQQHRVLEQLIATDNSLPSQRYAESPILRLAGSLIAAVMPDINALPLVGWHGPGSTADKVDVPFRWDVPLKLSTENESLFGFGTSWQIPVRGTVEFVESFQSRVALVPKDSRGPRVICMEPHGLMYMQQALQYDLHEHFNAHPLTKGHVNLLDQQVNRDIALRASSDRKFATVDMKEASDRVSVALVCSLFPAEWIPFLLSLRSETALLPDGRVLLQKKYAPMGSALCFPIETLVFWALSAAGIARFLGIDVMKAASYVWVHGDDTIVPTKTYAFVCDTIESYDLIVNRDKSFCQGFFRESCGGDYYRGYDVAPVRWRSHVTDKPSKWLVPTVELSNSFYKKGWWRTADCITRWVQSHAHGFQLCVESVGNRRAVAFECYNTGALPNTAPKRWNKHLQRWEYRLLVVSPVKDARQPLEDGRYRRQLHLMARRKEIFLPHLGEVAPGYEPMKRAYRLRREWVPGYYQENPLLG